jgi:hypothetical protein
VKESVAPDYVTPVTGWRFWKIRKSPKDGNLWLKSVIRNDLWPPKEKFEAQRVSKGVSQTGVPPETHSKCGIYAYKTSRNALENLDRCCYRGSFLGKVNLWGVIQKHELGYRAQYAYPVSINMGICCMCKQIVQLSSEPFAIGWAAYHFSESFSVSGFLCEVCNEKYYSANIETSYKELVQLTSRYGITIE